MSKVTIVWFTEKGEPSRMLTLRRSWVTLLGSVGLFFLLLALVFMFLSWFQYSKIADYQKENEELRQIATEQEERISSLQEEVAAQEQSVETLRSKLEHSRNELEEIRDMELKLRQFLGIEEEKGGFEDHSHKGGFENSFYAGITSLPGTISGFPAPEAKESSPPAHLIPVLPQETEESPSGQSEASRQDYPEVLSYSLSLKESLREVVDALEDRDERLKRTPSILPVKGEDVWVSSEFGYRTNPFTERREFHSGIDIAGGHKTPIIAPADGEVMHIFENRIMGNVIQIRHRQDLRTTYGHLHSVAVQRGERVERGDIIGYMGNSGRSTGTHLHYEVVKQGEAIDPWNYILDRKDGTLALR